MKYNIYNYILETIRKEPRNTESHYPSRALTCKRKQYYQWRNAPETNSIENTALIKMEMGNSIHNTIAKVLEKSELKAIHEIECKVKITGLDKFISGRLDNIFEGKNKELVGIEIKSTYGRAIDDIKKNGAKIEHLAQIICYMETAKIDLFYLLYVDRETGYIYQNEINKNELVFAEINPDNVNQVVTFIENNYSYNQIWTDIIFNWASVEKALEENIIPLQDYYLTYPDEILQKNYRKYLSQTKAKRPQTIKQFKQYHNGDWQCKYCQYSKLCWNS